VCCSLYLRRLALTPVAPVFVHAPLALCRNISECGLVVVDIAVRAGGVCVSATRHVPARWCTLSLPLALSRRPVTMDLRRVFEDDLVQQGLASGRESRPGSHATTLGFESSLTPHATKQGLATLVLSGPTPITLENRWVSLHFPALYYYTSSEVPPRPRRYIPCQSI